MVPLFPEGRRLPKIIHQAYVPRSRLTPELRENISWIRRAHPGWEHRFYGEHEVEGFVWEHYGPRVARYFERISPTYNVVKVDLFKYLLIYQAGGVYLELFHSNAQRPAPKVEADGPGYSGFRPFAFRVDDLDAVLGQLGSDAHITLGPLDMSEFIPGMRAVWVADPEGNIVELNQGYVDEENPPPLIPD